MKKKRTDLVMTLIKDHLVSPLGYVNNLPKMPNGLLPWIKESVSGERAVEIVEEFSVKKGVLGEAIAELIDLNTAIDMEIAIFRVNFNIDTVSTREAQDIRDAIFDRLKLYVVKRRVPGSRGWRVGAIRRGSLSYNWGNSTHTYATDILITNKIWYNADQSQVVKFDDEEFIQLQKAAFTARDSTGHRANLRVKVRQYMNLKDASVEKLKLTSAFA